jgi:hypothetical protein
VSSWLVDQRAIGIDQVDVLYGVVVVERSCGIRGTLLIVR